MSPEIKEYLQMIVREFDNRLKLRGHYNSWQGDRRLKLWEQKIYSGAKRLLETEADKPQSTES